MNAHQMYRQTQAQTAAPGELIVMLYRGATRFVASAIEAIEANNVQAAHTYLLKAQAIVTELFDSLDLERGGEVAKNLMSIYDFMNRRLVDANLRKDAEPAREVERLLRELLPAWEQAVRQTAATPVRSMVSSAA
jgi:flagellar secretion chaperone FliS